MNAHAKVNLARTRQEFARDEWRRHVVQRLAAGELTITDEAAVLLDAIASTPQHVTTEPLSTLSVDHLNAHAEAVMVNPYTRARLRVLLDALAEHELLPPWCSWPQQPQAAEGVAL